MSSTATSSGWRVATGSAPAGCRRSWRSTSRARAPRARRAGGSRDRGMTSAPSWERSSEMWSSRGPTGNAWPRTVRARTTRSSATTTSDCGPRSFVACSGRWPRRCRRSRPTRRSALPPQALDIPVGAQQVAVASTLRRLGVDDASWRVDVSAHPFTAWMGRRDTRLTTRYGDGQVGVAAQLAARVWPRAVRATGRCGAGAHQPRARDVDVDARVPEQAVGEPRGAQPGVRRGAGRRPRRRRVRRRCRRAARHARGRRALADPRLGGSAHLPAAHHPALRARTRAHRRRARRRAICPQRGTTGCAACSASRFPSDALGCLQDVHWGAGSFGYFPSYALGCLIAAQLWEAMEAELGPREEDLREAKVAPIQRLARRARAPLRTTSRHDSAARSRPPDAAFRSSPSCVTSRRSPNPDYASSTLAPGPGRTSRASRGGPTPGANRPSTLPPKPPPTSRAPAAPAASSRSTVALDGGGGDLEAVAQALVGGVQQSTEAAPDRPRAERPRARAPARFPPARGSARRRSGSGSRVDGSSARLAQRPDAQQPTRPRAFCASRVVAGGRVRVPLTGVEHAPAASRPGAAARGRSRACGSRCSSAMSARRSSDASWSSRPVWAPVQSFSTRAHRRASSTRSMRDPARWARPRSSSATHSATSSAAEEDRPAPRGRSAADLQVARRRAGARLAASSATAPCTNARHPSAGERVGEREAVALAEVARVRLDALIAGARRLRRDTVTPWSIANGSASPRCSRCARRSG